MTDQSIIRETLVFDAGEIARIHCSSWRDAYASVLDPAFLAGPIEEDRRALWAARLTMRSKNQFVLVAELPSERPVAFVCGYREYDMQWGGLIDNLHVLHDQRGWRIGERLIRAAASIMSEGGNPSALHLWVFEANHAGLRFYQRLGGRVVERAASEIPAANGASVLRIFWPDCSTLWQRWR